MTTLVRALTLALVLWLPVSALAQVCSMVVNEPGEDICQVGYPDNFVRQTAFFQADAFGCGGSASPAGIGYGGPFHEVTVRSTSAIATGDTINVEMVGWASGASGSRSLQAEVSADNVTFVPCDVAPAREYIGNGAPDQLTCVSPFDSAELYVRLSMTTASSALVYIRSVSVETCFTPVPTLSEWAMVVFFCILALSMIVAARRDRARG